MFVFVGWVYCSLVSVFFSNFQCVIVVCCFFIGFLGSCVYREGLPVLEAGMQGQVGEERSGGDALWGPQEMGAGVKQGSSLYLLQH